MLLTLFSLAAARRRGRFTCGMKMTYDPSHYASPARIAGLPPAQGLYLPEFEKDACGVGFICHIKGKQTHNIVSDALTMLENMNHRGACGCEPDSGDGAGIMVRMPDTFYRAKMAVQGVVLPKAGQYGVAMMFLPRARMSRLECVRIFEQVVRENGMSILGWRDVPVDHSQVGPTPGKTEPVIRQCFIAPTETFFNKADFDRRLYLVRQISENRLEFGDFTPESKEEFYICICSANRMVYKGMLTAHQVREYYLDLKDPAFESSLAIVHSRFSTNTFPSWRLAHPYRYLSHNGEINTLRGNRNWMRARTGSLKSSVFGDEMYKLFPILTESGSDSATLDNMVQFLSVNGRSLPHAMLMVIPEAWQNNSQMDPDLKAFYEYHACLMEPWDGPASVAFTNGPIVGAVLDRNGLRPSRYYVTKDDLVIMASEVGVIPVAADNIVKKWRLQPGKIFLIDSAEGRIIDDAEIKQDLVNSRPWKRWIEQNMIDLDSLPTPVGDARKPQAGGRARTTLQTLHPSPSSANLLELQQSFGYTNEDVKLLITPMASTGGEALGSMGTDTPLACLSDRPQLLYNYFKQLFAQVTNPPLDAMREELVTSLYTYLGREGNLLEETPKACHLVKLKYPILTNEDLEKLRGVNHGDLKGRTVPTLFNIAEGEAGLKQALDELCAAASKAVAEGTSILVLSDRGVSETLAPIPALLATAAVHHHLIREGTRSYASLVIETGEAREAHHFCTLLGYGAGAINPYLAFETIHDLHADGFLPAETTLDQARKNYIKAANKAILKVASKMGISTVQSYRGAQIFEAIGLSKDVIDQYFTNTASRIGGIPLEVIAREALDRHRRGFPQRHVEVDVLPTGGNYQWRRDGEYHMWNPDSLAKLQHAVRIDSFHTFKEFTKLIDDEARHRCTLRGLLNFSRGQRSAIPLDQVEPAKEIVKRFVTGAMSFGSISKEAHENLAVAMNRLGGKSNTGEGGEDPRRFLPDTDLKWPDGEPYLRRSAIKQVASGRFGVTIEYLVNADELQIKMAQGAKPGEGGQLPGHKVDAFIAKVRHSTPGVGLISPPPHHDIYSIEDLAQLIHDLKNVNPKARVSVKLVSEVGVGTVAAGVAKAKADHILISGDGGGTGASPLTSIKHAGIPWELGLAETQQVLVMNNLRGRVVVQTDGQIKTGRDVAIAALLGAEEFGFSTAPLIASGCILMRVCHLNTCPVGIATQDPDLRRKFAGKPEHVINYFFFVAEEVRAIMAELGFATMEEMVGQSQHLSFADVSDHWKAKHLDLSVILHKPAVPDTVAVRHVENQDHGLSESLDNTKLIELARPALERGERVKADLPITNINRTVATTLSGEIGKKYGFAGLPDDTIHFKFNGSAGQSFGAFAARGITLELEGDANDYLGKGVSGARIVVYPPKNATFKAEENIIAGNVIAYGAIAGEIYLRGVVGERFCVRNSGANAVVEGVGDHACEYMTGGRVVVIGPTGRNFAAGMSGGIAYVYDSVGNFPSLCNMEMVELEKVEKTDDVEFLKKMLQNHANYTESPVAQAILDDFDKEVRWFVKVMPTDYRRVMEHLAETEAAAERLGETQTAGV